MPDSEHTEQATGYVVVSIWRPARFQSNKWTYEFFVHLSDAVAHHVAIGEGRVRDHDQNGIFPVRDELPVGPALDVEAIMTAPVVVWKWPSRSAPCTPENKSLSEKYIANGFAPAGKEVPL